jgi:hypothetical protein
MHAIMGESVSGIPNFENRFEVRELQVGSIGGGGGGGEGGTRYKPMSACCDLLLPLIIFDN